MGPVRGKRGKRRRRSGSRLKALPGNAPAPAMQSDLEDFPIPTGPTDLERLVRVRRVQGFFRASVLASYEFRCAVTGLAVPELLNASHIVHGRHP